RAILRMPRALSLESNQPPRSLEQIQKVPASLRAGGWLKIFCPSDRPMGSGAVTKSKSTPPYRSFWIPPPLPPRGQTRAACGILPPRCPPGYPRQILLPGLIVCFGDLGSQPERLYGQLHT